MKKILVLIAMISVAFSCSNDLTDMNVDPKKPTVTKAEYLFTNAEKKLVDQMVSTSVNYNVFRLFVQQWTETTYPNESQYDLTSRKIPDNHFTVLYRDVLADFNEAKIMINQIAAVTDTDLAVRQNKLALIDILEVYTYSILVDTFGNVPYSQGGDIQKYPLPAYDDAKTIYKDLVKRLFEAQSILKKNASNVNFGSADIIYSGDALSNLKWAKFANSLVIRLAVNISDIEPDYAATQIKDALANGVLSGNADNTKLTYLSTTGNQNPLYTDLVLSGRSDFIPADTFVEAMDHVVPGGDPRMVKYFVNGSPKPVLPAGRTFIGGTYGEANVYTSYSHLTTAFNNPSFAGTIFDYAELQFLLAEAAEKNLIPGGSTQAENYYNAGVTASMLDWGLTEADALAYLAKPTVKYSSIQSGETWKQKIGTQAWFALYNRGFEAWTSYRRLDFPILQSPTSAVNKGILTVPVRYTYPGKEQSVNTTNYSKASSDIGGDKLNTKLFWDKY
ncbi:SusD/RagB family nutrient-binding outer membrane lipoprotein [Flavobacterium sp. KACC 22761]|uniref:SusD/RagB family nutrient-binding outer membrane lipoprotein n=1 Tax=Flavobacterium sp. KACC 22761 TaxID=3092665 RepID=UPI002A75CF5F|nr:SusD/RagB family nutrient-binding outer membrane lipoprotein [Flavobacterium sp. KACC 22761]WPO76920.1 SusD/RagB family nutrient-binding outer membrane lipoprotein [Flavobacterium sp. KACC 22761]